MNPRNDKSIALYLVCLTDISWLLMDFFGVVKLTGMRHTLRNDGALFLCPYDHICRILIWEMVAWVRRIYPPNI